MVVLSFFLFSIFANDKIIKKQIPQRPLVGIYSKEKDPFLIPWKYFFTEESLGFVPFMDVKNGSLCRVHANNFLATELSTKELKQILQWIQISKHPMEDLSSLAKVAEYYGPNSLVNLLVDSEVSYPEMKDFLLQAIDKFKTDWNGILGYKIYELLSKYDIKDTDLSIGDLYRLRPPHESYEIIQVKDNSSEIFYDREDYLRFKEEVEELPNINFFIEYNIYDIHEKVYEFSNLLQSYSLLKHRPSLILLLKKNLIREDYFKKINPDNKIKNIVIPF